MGRAAREQQGRSTSTRQVDMVDLPTGENVCQRVEIVPGLG